MLFDASSQYYWDLNVGQWAGVHSSISAHIADKYLLDEAKGVWGPHLPLFRERLGNDGVKERVENLYFTYLFVLRAIMKAGPLLSNVEYDTGMPEQDAHTLHLVKTLVSAAPLPKSYMPSRKFNSHKTLDFPVVVTLHTLP